ncbi:translation initiation factor IF-2 [Desulfobacula sp.]|uniref:translation initiation factor IF-2 n=1 Tax=Desulfobacula sp. TaxID=2593537 RepID=UPI002634AFF2|nr:translation initiation factor IF-2 [Desulfobacula sp.]
MAKVRVYELAKDLNMTNRAFLNKMKELKIDVKSHMSSLEDSAVSAIKRSLLGKNKRKADVKIKPSVIRRRRQRVEESAAPEVEEETAERVEEKPEQTGALKKESPAQKEVKVTSSDDEPRAVKEESKDQKIKKATKKVKPALQKNKPKPKIKKGRSAKIIKSAEVEKLKTLESGKTKSEPEVDKTAIPPVGKEESIVGKDKKPVKIQTKTLVEKEDTVQGIDPVTAEDKEKKTKKKKKKSTPAKIVKIADPSSLENLRKPKSGKDKSRVDTRSETKGRAKKKPFKKKERVPSPSPVNPKMAAPAVGIPMPGEIDTGKRKKEKRKVEFGDDKPVGKRKQRKRKSVIEGDALYKGGRGRKKRGRKDIKGKRGNFQKTQITTPKAIKRRIKIDEAIELSELAKRMGIKANEMIVKLMGMGVMATVNQTIDFDTAVLVATEFDFEVEKASFEEDALLNIENGDEDEEKLVGRAPVVTIMGHVDHGKTSLLDVIRQSKITSGEAGGITQHIGAYNVETLNGGRITFLDTPGHAAFTAMRSRGAQITDIVILVVAADDGVMPQTIEAINHSKAAGVPVLVAVNKMDKAGADPDRIMRELSELDLLAEEWGGDVIFVKVSAKTGEGIDTLLEMVLLQSEVLELKANHERKANGYVVESRLDTGRGAVATVLVKQGTLRDGDSIVCGLHSGRIRAMMDDAGNRIKEAGPSTPVEIVGLHGIPNAGDEFIAVASDKDAKQIAGHRMQKQRARELAKKSRANLEKMFENLGSAEIKELKLIVKADVQGSIEALNDSLNDLAKEEVDIKIVHSGTGTINESDVALAAVSDAIIVGFNVRPTPQIRTLAKEENVDMRFYDIIYNVIDDIKTALDGMMPSTFHEIIIGQADVRNVFVIPKMGTIAGCHISEGKVVRGKKVRLLRDGVIKCDTQLSSLRRFKDDVKEVDRGYECGIGLEKYNDIKVDDVIECYEVEERKYKAD